MMIRTLALSLGVALGGCVIHTAEPASSTTTTRAPYDPHFRVSDEIYSTCQLASRANMDVAEGTAYCLRTGSLNARRVSISGSQVEVDRARDRLIGNGVDVSRIRTFYTDGPAYVEVMQDTLNKHKRTY